MPQILATAQAQFPRSANKTVRVEAAWRPSGDKQSPEPNGSDGWTTIGRSATYLLVEQLRDKGYTWVNLSAGGTANPFKDVRISTLI